MLIKGNFKGLSLYKEGLFPELDSRAFDFVVLDSELRSILSSFGYEPKQVDLTSQVFKTMSESDYQQNIDSDYRTGMFSKVLKYDFEISSKWENYEVDYSYVFLVDSIYCEEEMEGLELKLDVNNSEMELMFKMIS